MLNEQDQRGQVLAESVPQITAHPRVRALLPGEPNVQHHADRAGTVEAAIRAACSCGSSASAARRVLMSQFRNGSVVRSSAWTCKIQPVPTLPNRSHRGPCGSGGKIAVAATHRFSLANSCSAAPMHAFIASMDRAIASRAIVDVGALTLHRIRWEALIQGRRSDPEACRSCGRRRRRPVRLVDRAAQDADRGGRSGP